MKPVAMHAGVACGTSSRAREKELPEELRKQGAPRPVPLRSASHPMGIPNLSHYNQQKVVAANKLYVLVFQLILYCFDNGIVFSVENPWRSWFWSVLVELAKEHSKDACRKINQLHSVIRIHACTGVLEQNELVLTQHKTPTTSFSWIAITNTNTHHTVFSWMEYGSSTRLRKELILTCSANA